MIKKSRQEWTIGRPVVVKSGVIKRVHPKHGWVQIDPAATIAISKGGRFRSASEAKIASVQRSFEKARRGKNLFGLEDA